MLTSLPKRSQAIPQHAHLEWISSRAEDLSCSMSSSPAITADGKTNHPSSIILEPENNKPVGASIKETSSTATRTPEELRRGHRGGGDHDGFGGVLNLHEEDEEACVTLAITTCKRLQLFLGTAEGLQVSCWSWTFEAVRGISYLRLLQCTHRKIDKKENSCVRSAKTRGKLARILPMTAHSTSSQYPSLPAFWKPDRPPLLECGIRISGSLISLSLNSSVTSPHVFLLFDQTRYRVCLALFRKVMRAAPAPRGCATCLSLMTGALRRNAA